MKENKTFEYQKHHEFPHFKYTEKKPYYLAKIICHNFYQYNWKNNRYCGNNII